MRTAAIVPVFNETPSIIDSLRDLAALDGIDDLIVSDASDSQECVDALASLQRDCPRIKVLRCATAQRAAQMNLAAEQVDGDVLWFVHADTNPPANAAQLVRDRLAKDSSWGRFDVCFDSQRTIMKIVAWLMNRRSAISGICTGDQAMFVRRDLFLEVGGFPSIPLLEDVVLCKRLKRHAAPARIRTQVRTSARRWEANGYAHTILLMWALRLLHFLGVSPVTLSRLYGPARQ